MRIGFKSGGPSHGKVEVAPMVFRCEGWRHAISLAADGSILADGKKVADGRMKLVRGACCSRKRLRRSNPPRIAPAPAPDQRSHG